MNIFAYLYNLIFYRPILNLLIFFYQTIGLQNLGFAIILTTLFIRFILYPFFHKGAKQQILMQRIQPKVKKIQELHKDDREKQGQALMDLYKEHGINPFSSFLLLLIQLPILLAFYWVVRSGLTPGALTGVYSFLSTPQTINVMFLHVINLSKPNLILILLAAIAQFFQARLAIYKNPTTNSTPTPAEKIARQMVFVGPLITILIFYNLPAAVGLYWLVSSVFSAAQQYFVNKKLRKQYGA